MQKKEVCAIIPIVSIIFAIGLPAFALWRGEQLRSPWLWSVGSFVFCALAMITELFTVRRRAFAGDWSGIEDTIGAVLVICIGLLAVCTVMNLILLGIHYSEDKK